ncbi:MAG: M20/M25/M40 family metallo-hydrolase [Gemmatimonadaceae bacterium]
MRRLPVLAAALLLGSHLASAQTFPTNDQTIERIWSVGMDSSHTYQLSQVLFDSLGPRLMGGPDLRSAQNWLVKTYKSWGIDAKNEQYGTWRGWRRGTSHIDLVSPRVRTLEGTMVGYSPGTGGKDVTSDVVVLPRFKDSTEFVKWLPQARGKLVLVAAPMPTCRTPEDWEKDATPASLARMDTLAAHTQAEWAQGRDGVRGTGYTMALGGGTLGMRMEKAGIAGLITSRPKLTWRIPAANAAPGGGRGGSPIGTGGRGAMEIFETYNTVAPTIALACEDYGLVFRLAENNQHPRVKLNLDGHLLGEQPVFNTVARINGTEKPNEYVMLSAHFDSWDGSSGATDNGTGTITMLEAMRILKDVYPRPKRTILVGHWSGEEEGEVGSSAFREDHPDIMKGLQALFNQDNGTGRIVRMSAAGIPDADVHIRGWLDKIPTEFKAQIQYGGIGNPAGGGSDDFSFFCAGLPAFGLGALSWDYGNYTWHTERDTFDKVVFDDLKSNATLTAMLAYLASEDPTMIAHINPDSARTAMAAAAANAPPDAAAAAGRGGRGGAARTWPVCAKAPRVTNPRLR